MQEKDNEMIELPSLTEQAKAVAKARLDEASEQLLALKTQPVINVKLAIDESAFCQAHLLEKDRGWKPPAPEIVTAYFEQLKRYNRQYTESGIAVLLGLAPSSDRNIRKWKSGERQVPYELWRKFLVATGRAPVEVPQIVGFFV